MPQLNSPSSRAHMMCKGLRPANFVQELNLISKKIDVANTKQQLTSNGIE